MASIGHIAVGMVAARLASRQGKSRWSLLAVTVGWSALSLLPDADVLGFRFGIRYADSWGHRGATHSFAFAFATALALSSVAAVFRLPTVRTGILAFAVIASHAVLDTLTDGGLGCALLWPFDETRYFAPWRPIPVAPIGRRFFSLSGLDVALREMIFFSPLIVYAMWRPSREPGPNGSHR